MQKRAEKEVLGHFFEFGTSDRLDVADFDREKCFSAFGGDKRPCIINKA